jgi:hypothetical protein
MADQFLIGPKATGMFHEAMPHFVDQIDRR